MVEFKYQEIFEHGPDTTPYRKLTSDYVSTERWNGVEVLKVEPAGLSLLASTAIDDAEHLLRPDHLRQLKNILEDPEASENDRFCGPRVPQERQHLCRADPPRVSGYRNGYRARLQG